MIERSAHLLVLCLPIPLNNLNLPKHQPDQCVLSLSASNIYTSAMPPQQIVVQSNPKWQFLMALDLDGRDREDQAIYWIMKVCTGRLVLTERS